MNFKTGNFKTMFGKGLLFGALAFSLLGGMAIPAHADRDDHGRCERDVRNAERNLDNAVRKHGEHSRQAEKRRHQLEELRERCHVADRDRDHH